jgi:hypothetical protein
MKSPIKYSVYLVAIFLLTWSCQEKNEGNPQRIDREIDNVVALLADELLVVEVQGGDENSSFGFRTLEDGSYLTENNADKGTHEKQVGKSKLVTCLQNLDLSQEQLADSRNLILGMVKCRMDAFELLKEELFDIILAMENQRLSLLEKLLKQEINRDEFKAGLKDVRERFKNEIEDIREKHLEMIKPCLRELVVELREIIGEEKWEDLYACIKS